LGSYARGETRLRERDAYLYVIERKKGTQPRGRTFCGKELKGTPPLYLGGRIADMPLMKEKNSWKKKKKTNRAGSEGSEGGIWGEASLFSLTKGGAIGSHRRRGKMNICFSKKGGEGFIEAKRRECSYKKGGIEKRPTINRSVA